MVEEKKATAELIECALALIDKGTDIPSYSAEAIHEWFEADDDRPFPEVEFHNPSSSGVSISQLCRCRHVMDMSALPS